MLYVIEAGEYSDRSTVAIFEGPDTGNIDTMRESWLASLSHHEVVDIEDNGYGSTKYAFIQWLALQPTWWEVPYREWKVADSTEVFGWDIRLARAEQALSLG